MPNRGSVNDYNDNNLFNKKLLFNVFLKDFEGSVTDEKYKKYFVTKNTYLSDQIVHSNKKFNVYNFKFNL